MALFLFFAFGLVNLITASPVTENNAITSSNYDVTRIEVTNRGHSDSSAVFSLYFDEDTDLIRYEAEKEDSDHLKRASRAVVEPTSYADGAFDVDREAAMTSLSFGNDDEGSFEFTYQSFGESAKKRTNNFLVTVDVENCRGAEVVFSSANFDVSSYPPNSRHLYLFRCNQSYNFNLNVTNFELERGMDTLTVYSVSSQQSKTVISEVKAVGLVPTHTNQLLVEFRSDCDTSFSGFRGVLTTVGSMTSTHPPTTQAHTTTQRSTKCYTYAITPDRGNYQASQQACKELFGGQLVSHNLGKDGINYHNDIKEIVEANWDKNFWVGISDEKTEGEWLFTSNGQEADFDEMIFKWRHEQPDNIGNEDCAHTWEKSEMNDVPCRFVSAWGKDIYGLCEIKADHCTTYPVKTTPKSTDPKSTTPVTTTSPVSTTKVYETTQRSTKCYNYAITPYYGDYQTSQQACQDLFGGQLVSHNLGKDGINYHNDIKNIVKSNPNKALWLGLSDERTEGKWLFSSNGQEANFDDVIFKWTAGQPNNVNGTENCAHTWGESGMNDLQCSSASLYGINVYGLCEIKADYCRYSDISF